MTKTEDNRTSLSGKFLITLIIGALAVGAFFYFNGKMTSGNDNKGRKGSEIIVKVITRPVEMVENSSVFRAVGTGKAVLSAALYPAVSDEVTDVLFKAQDRVKKGDILVQLDDREEKLALKLAQVELNDTKSLLDRYEKAVKQGAVPQSEVDSAKTANESAQVALERAQLSLEARQIIAPFDGIVGIPNVDPGDRVDASTLITGLDDRHVLYVDFEVPEALAGALQDAQKQKQRITAITPAYPGQEFEALISAQESRLDPARRTLVARADIINKDDTLRPGMSFATSWEIKGKTYPAVPEISVQWSRDGAFVWVIRDNKAVMIEGNVIARKNSMVLLESALKADDQIVIEGLQRLRPDLTVEVLGNDKEAAGI